MQNNECALQAAYADLQANFDNRERATAAASRELQAQMQSMQARIDSLLAEAASSGSDTLVATADLAVAKAKADALEAQVVALQETVAKAEQSLSDTVAKHKEATDAMEDRIIASEAARVDLSSQLLDKDLKLQSYEEGGDYNEEDWCDEHWQDAEH